MSIRQRRNPRSRGYERLVNGAEVKLQEIHEIADEIFSGVAIRYGQAYLHPHVELLDQRLDRTLEALQKIQDELAEEE